ncbi:MFS general substrate transporter [Xylariaceae sp. FL0016]|nr:MFS general substrate transporter [Xylariaceae sp. FL0016]
MKFVANARQFLSGTRKDESSKPPHLLRLRSSTTLILLTVNLAIFTDIFFYALVIPVIPFSLTVQVGIPQDQVQHWTSILLACYSVALLVGSPFAGVYADHTSSRRWPLLIGLVTLAASTLLLCFGNTIGLLVLGRLLQGFSAAIVWSVGCALLVDTMENSVGVAMGYVNISMSMGLLIAPVIGGAVYAATGYYAVYYVAFGVVGVDILLRLLMIEKKVARQWIQEEDDPPAVLERTHDPEKATTRFNTEGHDHRTNITGAASTMLEATTTESESAPRGLSDTSRIGDPPTRASLQAATVPPATSRTPSKTSTIVALLKSPRLLAALYGITVEAGIMMGFDAVLALFVYRTFEWKSTAAGILFLALFIPGFISPFVGWLADKYGAKYPSLFGFSCTVPLLVCLRFVTHDTIQHKVLLGILLSLLGTALAFSNTPLMAEMSYAIEEKAAENPGIFGERGVYGLGYGLFTMAFALGGTIGPLWAGYVVSAAGWGTMTWSFAVWAASGALVVGIWMGQKKKPQDSSVGEENVAAESL